MKSIKYLIIIFFLISLSTESYSGTLNHTEGRPKQELKLYPNPVTNNNFTVISDLGVIEVKVLNVLGQQVCQFKVLNEKRVNVELEGNEKGLYLVQIKTVDNQISTKRILFK